MFKKVMTGVAITITVILSVSFFSGQLEAKTGDFSHLTFTTSHDSFRIFDHQTGKIYMYSSTRGDLYRIFTLEEPGKDLIKEK